MVVGKRRGAKFWLGILTQLKTRGLEDILIACVDGLKGFPEAIQTVYPQTHIQLCIVHMVRNSMKFVPWRDYKEVAGDLKRVYQSPTEDEALRELDQVDEKWRIKYPLITRSWRQNWDNLNTLFAYPTEIRKASITSKTS